MACIQIFVIFLKHFPITIIVVISYEVLFVLPFSARGSIHVFVYVFHVCFGFSLPFIVAEEEMSNDYGVMKESNFLSIYNDHGDFLWLLHAGRYKIYGVSLEFFATS